MAATVTAVGGTLTAVGGASPAATGTLLQGNAKSYYVSGPWSAYTGMWAVGIPTNTGLVSDSSMKVFPTAFPVGIEFSWDISARDLRWTGVEGMLAVSYGNYADSPGSVTPTQVSAITDLAATVGWSYAGDDSSGLLCETWLTSTSTPTGDGTHLFEVGFMPKVSANAQAYIAGLTSVGTFTDKNGVAWLVAEDTSPTAPYLIAYRSGYADFTGDLCFHDYFTFLIAQGKITGSEWFNGLGFGVEPYDGAGSLVISDFSVNYAVWSGPAKITDDFSGTLAKWNGSTYGVDIVSGRLRIPCSNSYPQAAIAASPGQDLTAYPLSVQMPTTPAAGTGTTQTHFNLSNGSNGVHFNLNGAPLNFSMGGSGLATSWLTYSATAHQWLRFRLSGGNLLWETSPDDATWTVRKTVTAPSWITSAPVGVTLDSSYYGTETTPGYAEFDNFNL